MVQFRIVSGKQCGAVQAIKRFPCVIGRAKSAHWRLEAPGIWDRHLQVDLCRKKGITLTLLPGAAATLNREPFERAVLRNGDLIEAGSLKLQFWLAATRQRSSRSREFLTWLALIVLCLAQIALIVALLP